MSSDDLPAPISTRNSSVRVLTPTVLQEALLKDVGQEAEFKSFEVIDFCSKGDNFACYVTSVAVKYALDSEEKCATYVAKLNQFGGIKEFESFSRLAFEKEGKFLCELVSAMDQLRKAVGLSPLKYPTCFYASNAAGQELLLLEDMRNKSFRLADAAKVGLDNDHVLLVVQELARLHATSMLLEEQMGTEEFSTTFNIFDEMFKKDIATPAFVESVKGYVRNGVLAAGKLGGHEELVARLTEIAPRSFEIMTAAVLTCDPKFRAVNHGDCWINNILFRYDGDKVADVCLLDLQIIRHASIGTDLNYFLFTSVNSDIRKTNLMTHLSAYYDAFKAVFDASNKPMKFSLDELYKEYRKKNTIGVIMGFMMVMHYGLKNDDAPDFTELKDDNVSEKVDDIHMKLNAALDVNPVLRSRLVDLMEEIEENKIF